MTEPKPAGLDEAVGAFAWRASESVISPLIEALVSEAGLSPEGIARLSAAIPDPSVRRDAADLLERWRAAALAQPLALAWMLRGALGAAHVKRTTEHAEIVWSGPISTRSHFRRTDEALLELIREARRTLTLVTFAAYRIPEVRQALEGALDRGVEVRFVGETGEASEGRLRFDAAGALGQSLARRVRILEWPRESRSRDARGLVGSLHAKCALADDAILLVSSANLTESALDANMEMGVLLRGGALPVAAARHFEELLSRGLLRPLANAEPK